MDKHIYQARKFTINSDMNDRKIFEGYTTGELWNGWECPFFTKEVGLKVAEAFSCKEYPIRYSIEKDAFVADFDDGCFEEFMPEDVQIETGEILHLYPIGAWCWIWDAISEEDISEDDISEEDSINNE